jgi:uncharacterized protein YbbK (DUF523 family)
MEFMKIKVGISSCLLGYKVNYQGVDLTVEKVVDLVNEFEMEYFPFCPEDSVFGTPRNKLRIVGGNGDDVWSGQAKVIDQCGVDVSDASKKGASNFLQVLKSNDIKVATLTNGSPSCGSSLLLNNDNWPNGGLIDGFGVTCSLLKANKIKVFSHSQIEEIRSYLTSL